MSEKQATYYPFVEEESNLLKAVYPSLAEEQTISESLDESSTIVEDLNISISSCRGLKWYITALVE